jgi:hypothetical protein
MMVCETGSVAGFVCVNRRIGSSSDAQALNGSGYTGFEGGHGWESLERSKCSSKPLGYASGAGFLCASSVQDSLGVTD